jgi:hypothetical protein
MSHRGPRMIREPELRWPIYLVAFILTALLMLFTWTVVRLTVGQSPAVPAGAALPAGVFVAATTGSNGLTR